MGGAYVRARTYTHTHTRALLEVTDGRMIRACVRVRVRIRVCPTSLPPFYSGSLIETGWRENTRTDAQTIIHALWPLDSPILWFVRADARKCMGRHHRMICIVVQVIELRGAQCKRGKRAVWTPVLSFAGL